METSENIEIINQAYSLIKNEYVFQRSTMYLQNSFGMEYLKMPTPKWIIF